jgi:hypothetical protein
MAEDHGKYHHANERLKNHPTDADHALFVADLEISPNYEIQENAVLPDRREIEV